MPDDSPQPQPATPSTSADDDAAEIAAIRLVWEALVKAGSALGEHADAKAKAFIESAATGVFALADLADRLLAEKARAEAALEQLPQKIMNLPIEKAELIKSIETTGGYGYRYGHRDARHAAVELVTATLAATAPAATETKEQENAR